MHHVVYLLLHRRSSQMLRVSDGFSSPHAPSLSDPVLTPSPALLVAPLKLIATVVSFLHRTSGNVEIPEIQL